MFVPLAVAHVATSGVNSWRSCPGVAMMDSVADCRMRLRLSVRLADGQPRRAAARLSYIEMV